MRTSIQAARKIAEEHIIYCKCAGMSGNDVLVSVGLSPSPENMWPTWSEITADLAAVYWSMKDSKRLAA